MATAVSGRIAGSRRTPYIATRKVAASNTKQASMPIVTVIRPAAIGPVSRLTWSARRDNARPAPTRSAPRSRIGNDRLAGDPAAPKPVCRATTV